MYIVSEGGDGGGGGGRGGGDGKGRHEGTGRGGSGGRVDVVVCTFLGLFFWGGVLDFVTGGKGERVGSGGFRCAGGILLL